MNPGEERVEVWGKKIYISELIDSMQKDAEEHHKRMKSTYENIAKMLPKKSTDYKISILHKLADTQLQIARMENKSETPSRNRALESLMQIEDYYKQELENLKRENQ